MADAPDATEARGIDPARQEKAREYAAIRRRLYVVDLAIGALYCVAFIASGASPALRTALAALSPLPAVLVALYLACFGAGYFVLTLPLTFYSGYALPHRYGLSVQSLPAWLGDLAKSSLLSGALTLALVEVVYFLIAALPDLWWLVTAGVVLLVSVVLAQLAPILLVPLFYKLTPLSGGEVAERLRRMAEQAGARVRGVYSINFSSKTTAANAALMGLGRTRSIVIGDTLLDRYTPDEIATVFAHELGHHVHRDIPKLVLVQSALTLVGLYLVSLFLRWGVAALGYQSIADVAGLPLLALGLGAFAAVTMPLANGFSRHVEAAADRYALETTGAPEAFISAMVRLANQNLAEYSPPRWVEVLLYDHPALSRRVAAARAYRAPSAEAEDA